ncbi:hypothetical protein HMPREF2939_06750 [Achromobacter xylosoxidans]|nr:hypothetical protein HMPREF2939_06750 [Achromobacter xylosoxidans]
MVSRYFKALRDREATLRVLLFQTDCPIGFSWIFEFTKKITKQIIATLKAFSSRAHDRIKTIGSPGVLYQHLPIFTESGILIVTLCELIEKNDHVLWPSHQSCEAIP